jgi:hypothetical protein
MNCLIELPKKDYFINLEKLDNAWMKTLGLNGIDMRAVEKIEIKTWIGDKTFLTVVEKENND